MGRKSVQQKPASGQVDSLSFPIPQFIVIGKQSVGKSRLIEVPVFAKHWPEGFEKMTRGLRLIYISFFFWGVLSVVERPWQERRSTLSLVRWVQGAKMIKHARHELYDRQAEVCLLFGPGGQPSWSSAMCLASLLQGRLISKDFSSGIRSASILCKSLSRWSVFDENLKRWSSYPVQEVMQIVGSAHEASDAALGISCWLFGLVTSLTHGGTCSLCRSSLPLLNPFPNIAEGMRTECQRAAN